MYLGTTKRIHGIPWILNEAELFAFYIEYVESNNIQCYVGYIQWRNISQKKCSFKGSWQLVNISVEKGLWSLLLTRKSRLIYAN